MELHQLFYPQLTEAVFGEQVCRVDFARDFTQVDTPEADGLLDPQGVGIQVSQFAKALPVANAYGCAGIRPHAQIDTYTKVAEERLISKALSRSAYDPGELGFGRAQRDRRLRG